MLSFALLCECLSIPLRFTVIKSAELGYCQMRAGGT